MTAKNHAQQTKVSRKWRSRGGCSTRWLQHDEAAPRSSCSRNLPNKKSFGILSCNNELKISCLAALFTGTRLALTSHLLSYYSITVDNWDQRLHKNALSCRCPLQSSNYGMLHHYGAWMKLQRKKTFRTNIEHNFRSSSRDRQLDATYTIKKSGK